MEMGVQSRGLTGCPEEQQKIACFRVWLGQREGKGWKENIKTRDSQATQRQKKPMASGTARPRGRQRAAVGLRSLAGASAASAVPEGSPWERGEHLSPHPVATRPSRHVEGWAKALSGCSGPRGEEKERVEGRARGSAGPPELGRLSSGPASAKARGAAMGQRGPGRGCAPAVEGPRDAPAGAWTADLTVRAPRAAVCKCPPGPAPRACGPHVQ